MVFVHKADELLEDLVHACRFLPGALFAGLVHPVAPGVGAQVGKGGQEGSDDLLLVVEGAREDFSEQVEVIVGQGQLLLVQGDARVVEQAHIVLERLQEVEPDAGHIVPRNQDEDEFRSGEAFPVAVRDFEDVPRDLDHQGILVHLVGVQVHVHLEVALLEEEEGVAVEPDRVLQHLQQRLALFRPAAADLADEEVVSDAVFVNDGRQALDFGNVDDLKDVLHLLMHFSFREDRTNFGPFAKFLPIRLFYQKWQGLLLKTGI